jgi:GTP pyrophosphokinase
MEQALTTLEEPMLKDSIKALVGFMRPLLLPGDITRIKKILLRGIEADSYHRDTFGMHPLINGFSTALELCHSVSPDRSMVIAIMLLCAVNAGSITMDELKKDWDEDITDTVGRLLKVASLYERHATVESENFRRLLLAFAEDIRVIIIMIVSRLAQMKAINHHPDEDRVRHVAYEAGYLYAPLAHRLGLYAIKSQLEDLSLKYTDRAVFTSIARKLNETKEKRDAYISNFIAPIKAKLEAEGLKFDIKGRTKSIYSIWNKMKKQKNDLDHIYDLFAIRIIIDAPLEREKAECWLAYSIVTDMYRPNPARMKDWISIPKTNGYESLHITVYGPDERWVEVQIRTRRMDEIAEKGLAAHWRYKGVKSEQGLDAWMKNVRDILETADTGPMELMKNLKLDVYNKEVFVFTPKGDLHRLPLGATVLDFAFNIHTGLGCRCTGGKVNGRNCKLNYKLQSGDTVEIQTSTSQQPKRDWLNFVVTGKARNKIRIVLKEQESRTAELGKELMQRRFKNRKIEIQESLLMKLIKKLGYKTSTEFFSRLAENEIDINTVLDAYLALTEKQVETTAAVSADEYVMQTPPEETPSRDNDILEIGNSDGIVKGLNYKLARCCNPIYGDNVFGFISSEGVVKIHREDCPNARNIRSRYPYRVIRTRWSGKFDGQMAATLSIIGHDDIGIVTNITSIINKEKSTSLRNISINSNDGLFQGYVVVGISSTEALTSLMKKIKDIKGVKDVTRADSAAATSVNQSNNKAKVKKK